MNLPSHSSDSKDLHYIFSEEEKDLRVDLCDKCNKYLKTLDMREVDRLIYPPLEQVATLPVRSPCRHGSRWGRTV